jgi:hypothetical protein
MSATWSVRGRPTDPIGVGGIGPGNIVSHRHLEADLDIFGRGTFSREAFDVWHYDSPFAVQSISADQRRRTELPPRLIASINAATSM